MSSVNKNQLLLTLALELMDSSSESDSDLDLLNIIDESDSAEGLVLNVLQFQFQKNEKNKVHNFFEEEVPTYSENKFRRHFRISRKLFVNLSKKFEQSKIYTCLRPDKRINGQKHLAVFLWFAGHESCSYRELANRFHLSLWTVFKMIDRITMFVSKLSPKVIKWPSDEKKKESSEFFDNKSGFAGAIGCIDVTRINIEPPTQRKEDYIDRKGNASVCLQAICDEKMKFINLFVGHPGPSHDSWIFQKSPIKQKLQNICGEYYILGDSSYPSCPYLVSPFRGSGHLTESQKEFNFKLRSCRIIIEHCFEKLKKQFPQLNYCKLKGIKKICHFIRACCVLHNISDQDDIDFSSDVESNGNTDVYT